MGQALRHPLESSKWDSMLGRSLLAEQATSRLHGCRVGLEGTACASFLGTL